MKLSDGSNVGHVPDPLARVLAPILDGGKIERMEGTVIYCYWWIAWRELLLLSQDLHPKASGFLAEGSSFLANMYTARCEKGPRKRKGKLSEKYKSQENGKEKTELPMSCCLLFSITLLR